jgi:hypothetical protein
VENNVLSDYYTDEKIKEVMSLNPSLRTKNRQGNQVFLTTLNGLQQNVNQQDLMDSKQTNQGFWAGNTIKKRE